MTLRRAPELLAKLRTREGCLCHPIRLPKCVADHACKQAHHGMSSFLRSLLQPLQTSFLDLLDLIPHEAQSRHVATSRARNHGANQKPSRPASKATATGLTLCLDRFPLPPAQELEQRM